MKSELEVDFFLADENKLLATAYDHLSWSKGFSLFFTWSVDNEKSWSTYERYVKDDTEKLCIITDPEYSLWDGTHKYNGKLYDL